ncbi:MAG: energy-coupling factor transporter transmembrane protein EcfT [Bacilli bacterium]|nr:energy-coupling factor transporter transmembrane protein EcfT [Bacilli bacterium]
MSSMVFGRYVSEKTFVHKLDPRTKIFLLILFSVAVFLHFTNNITSLLMAVGYLVLVFVLMICSKINILELFKSLSMMWFMMLFLLIIYIITPVPEPNLPVAFTIFGKVVYWDVFVNMGYIIVRLMLLISLAMVLTSSTRPMDMTYAFEWYMHPLKVIRFPVHEIAMTLSIALRFIPTLLDETNRIMKAQESRGADFKHGSIFKRFGAIISLIIPLFVSAIERSEQLANAMEARGYDPKAKRSRYKVLKGSWRDIVAIVFSLLIFGGIVFLLVYDSHVAQIVFF